MRNNILVISSFFQAFLSLAQIRHRLMWVIRHPPLCTQKNLPPYGLKQHPLGMAVWEE